jgi:hypothetical protein
MSWIRANILTPPLEQNRHETISEQATSGSLYSEPFAQLCRSFVPKTTHYSFTSINWNYHVPS